MSVEAREMFFRLIMDAIIAAGLSLLSTAATT